MKQWSAHANAAQFFFAESFLHNVMPNSRTSPSSLSALFLAATGRTLSVLTGQSPWKTERHLLFLQCYWAEPAEKFWTDWAEPVDKRMVFTNSVLLLSGARRKILALTGTQKLFGLVGNQRLAFLFVSFWWISLLWQSTQT